MRNIMDSILIYCFWEAWGTYWNRCPEYPYLKLRIQPGSEIQIESPAYWCSIEPCCCCCCVASVVSDSMRPHRRQPTRLPVPGILQARTLEWVAISFSNAWKWKVKVKSLSRVWLLATPWTAAHQAPPSMAFSRQEYHRSGWSHSKRVGRGKTRPGRGFQYLSQKKSCVCGNEGWKREWWPGWDCPVDFRRTE